MAFGRIAYAVIYPKGSDGIGLNTAVGENALDIKFSLKRLPGGTETDGTIEICNLDKDAIHYYTTFCSQAVEYKTQKRVELYAGYEDRGGAQKIFDGDLYDIATPAMPPDVWMALKVRTGHYKQSKTISKAINEPTPLQDVCRQVCDWYGNPMVWKCKRGTNNSKIIDKYECSASLDKALNELCKYGNIEFDLNPYSQVITFVDREPTLQEKEWDGKFKVDIEHGMIGVPKVNYQGVEVDIQLDPKVSKFDVFKLTSEVIPKADGYYSVMTYEHRGQLRSGEFVTHLNARRLVSSDAAQKKVGI